MLCLLLDEHVSPEVAQQLRNRIPALDVQPLREWQDGTYLGFSDAVILRVAQTERRTFVTYDLRTIPPLLKSWAEQGKNHAGVAFVDRRTVAPNDIGGLVAALASLYEREAEAVWTNRVVFLTRDRT